MPVSSSRLPPTAPTSLGNQNSMAPPLAAAPNGVTEHRHRARVTYTNGLLQVRADDSSLNQILRDISAETGMKIIGGVADQRVFGSYGPASAGAVRRRCSMAPERTCSCRSRSRTFPKHWSSRRAPEGPHRPVQARPATTSPRPSPIFRSPAPYSPQHQLVRRTPRNLQARPNARTQHSPPLLAQRRVTE